MQWNENSPHQTKFRPSNSDHNYCRNPDNDPNGPWCYTTDPRNRYDYCNVKHCKDQKRKGKVPGKTCLPNDDRLVILNISNFQLDIIYFLDLYSKIKFIEFRVLISVEVFGSHRSRAKTISVRFVLKVSLVNRYRTRKKVRNRTLCPLEDISLRASFYSALRCPK